MSSYKEDAKVLFLRVVFKHLSHLNVDSCEILRCDVVFLQVFVQYEAVIFTKIVSADKVRGFDNFIVVILDLWNIWVSLLNSSISFSPPDISKQSLHDYH